MQNRYFKRTHLSARKFRPILPLFCLDLTAVQIAQLAHLNRHTVNRVAQLLRQRMATLAEQESCFTTGEIEVDESYFGARRVRGKRGRGAAGKTIVFGLKKRGDKVYTQIVKNCSAAELVPIIRRLAPIDAVLYSDEWKSYDGLVNVGYQQHYRVKHQDEVFVNGKVHINGIENFWGIAKTRLAKFRGLPASQFYLYLKETEFRFNHRHDNLYKLLLKYLRKFPL
ncbi:MAG: IS1595 family transposase [Verrucomicrobiales bacterium]|jgi:transposase|nr:IS1595 family transposase [Verrucomicrobiales bacterium]